MEDYREIGPPGNGETRKTGASNLAAVRETTRHVRIHASRVIFRGALVGVSDNRIGKEFSIGPDGFELTDIQWLLAHYAAKLGFSKWSLAQVPLA